MFALVMWLTHFSLCLTRSLSSISPHNTLQGYVTVSEINELYSQLGQDPNPASAPALVKMTPESEVNLSPEEDSTKPMEDEVCGVMWRLSVFAVCSLVD